MQKMLRAATAALLALSLSGCFVSERPLITPDNADYPFKAAVKFSRYDLDDPAKKVDDGELVLNARNYTFRESKADSTVLFKAIGDRFYIVQQTTKSDKGEVQYLFELVRIDGKTIYSYDSDCSRARDTKFLRSGAIAKMEGKNATPTCTVKDLAGLTQVLKTRREDEPEARYVPR